MNFVMRKPSERPAVSVRGARECRRWRGWRGDVRLIGLLGGKRESKKRASWEGRGGARLARVLRRGQSADFGLFAGACGRWVEVRRLFAIYKNTLV
jgi:hypothetical protein